MWISPKHATIIVTASFVIHFRTIVPPQYTLNGSFAVIIADS